MFKTFQIRYKNNGTAQWIAETSAVMQSLRTLYPDVTLVRLNAQSYLATFKDEDKTIMGTPRFIVEQILNRDPVIDSVDWGDLEELL